MQMLVQVLEIFSRSLYIIFKSLSFAPSLSLFQFSKRSSVNESFSKCIQRARAECHMHGLQQTVSFHNKQNVLTSWVEFLIRLNFITD